MEERISNKRYFVLYIMDRVFDYLVFKTEKHLISSHFHKLQRNWFCKSFTSFVKINKMENVEKDLWKERAI